MCEGTHPYIPVINVAKAELQFLADGQKVENVFHFRNPVAWEASSLAFLANELKNWDTSHYSGARHADCILTGIKCTDLSSSSGAVVEVPIVPAHPGTIVAGQMLPNNVSLVIKWVTSQRGRSFRGRTYIPGLGSTMVLLSSPTAAMVTIAVGVASALWSMASVQNWDLVVVSYCNNKAWRTTGVSTKITSYAVEGTLDSQRRRLPGRGT